MVCIKPIFKKIYKKIKEYDEIVIARHVGPDPDAVASQIALRDTIKATFPNKKVYAVGKSVSKFKYFGLLDKIDNLTLNNPLLIVLDVPNIYRIDVLDVKEFKDILKIDHHIHQVDSVQVQHQYQQVHRQLLIRRIKVKMYRHT